MAEGGYKSPSYRTCTDWYDVHRPQADCAHLWTSTPDRPCWGRVGVAHEFSLDDGIFACEGHEMIWSDRDYAEYVPEPTTPDADD